MLSQLEARVRADLETIEHPPRGWLPPRRSACGRVVHDVIVVGAGLSGLTVAFGLVRQGITNVEVIDRAPAGAEGPWVTTARMDRLRSPKTLTGPDLGIASLTFRAWYEAVYGVEAFAALTRIARADWADYLAWYRRVLGITVRNDTSLVGLEPDGPRLRLRIERDGTPDAMLAQKVVLATGIEGNGARHVPRLVRERLPAGIYTHSGDAFDAATLAGKRVAVLGGAASAFDCAVTALRHRARRVDLIARRRVLPHVEVLAWTNFPGFLGHFSELDDARRFRFMQRFFELQAPPTEEAFIEATGDPRFTLHLAAPLTEAAFIDGTIRLGIGERTVEADHLLLGTGYTVDLGRRPELRGLAADVALWRDRFTPPAGEEDHPVLDHPYLDAAFAFTEKVPGTAPWLAHVHNFTTGAVPSLGPVCNGITGLKHGVPKLVAGIARGLFLAEADRLYDELRSYDEGVHLTPSSAAARP